MSHQFPLVIIWNIDITVLPIEQMFPSGPVVLVSNSMYPLAFIVRSVPH